MSEANNRYLDVFPEFLKTLAADVQEISELLKDETLPLPVRRHIAGSVNYLFKSLDLIPDGVEDIGYLDDAFVLRVASSMALAAGLPEAGAGVATVRRFAEENQVIREFLGDLYPRLETYVKALSKGAARGRTVDEIMTDPAVKDAFLSDVAAWASSYDVPTFTREDTTLTKMLSFLDSKLPKLRALRDLVDRRKSIKNENPLRQRKGLKTHAMRLSCSADQLALV